MKFIIPIVICYSCIIYCGCNKDSDRIIIEGNIVDPVQNIPVEDAEVVLYGKVLHGSTFNPVPSAITSVKSDQSGYFKINIEQIKASDFEIVIRKKQYFEYKDKPSEQQLSAGKPYERTFSILPEGWIDLHVENIMPVNNDDFISFRIMSDNPACNDCCNNNYVQGTGMNYDHKVLCRTVAKTEITIIWNVHKGGGSTADSSKHFIPLFDTLSYHLAY